MQTLTQLNETFAIPGALVSKFCHTAFAFFLSSHKRRVAHSCAL
jgi:hypothetical protein